MNFEQMLDNASRLVSGDFFQRLLAANIYESIRKHCRFNPDTTQELEAKLPRGYRLVPVK